MKMVRKQVYITKEQDEQLEHLADELGVTEAEVIREGLDLLKTKYERDRAEQAWERLEALMEARAKLKVPQQPRTWTRDDLYDD